MKKNELEKQNKEIMKNIESVQTKVNETRDLLNSPNNEIDEKYARDKLGYGLPNEKIYIDISGK